MASNGTARTTRWATALAGTPAPVGALAIAGPVAAASASEQRRIRSR